MNSRSLRSFDATAEALHMGRAAEQLGVAQPALSQQIGALETELGVRLFTRAHRRIALTDAGRVFLEEAKKLIAAEQHARRMAREADRGTAGELHIGYSGSVVFEPRLRQLLRRFRAAYPEVSLNLHENAVGELLDDLQSTRLDIAILRGPIGALPRGLEQEPFSRAPLMAALPADHPLAGSEVIDPGALADEPFLGFFDPPGLGLGASLSALGERAGFAPRVVLRAGSVMSVLGLVGAGLGVSVIPELRLGVSSAAFVLRPFDDPEAMTEALLVTRAPIVSPVQTRFLAMAREAAGT